MDEQRGSEEQAALWSGAGGRGWAASQELLDRVLQPFEDLVLGAIPADASRVLDVGCGTGATTVAIARRLGGRGACVGVDVAEVMIAAARARAERERVPVELVVGDAQTYPFAPETFDAVASRFGVMFFRDAVEAFANLRGAARRGAALRCVVWRSAEENAFMTAAERAAAPLLPGLPVRRPDEPGQFGLADPDRTGRVLAESGWSAVDVRPIDVPCVMPESALAQYLTTVGPVGRALERADDALRARVLAAVRPAFDPWIHGPELRFTAACWMLVARA
jgi:SAM-dependent methyltransferase